MNEGIEPLVVIAQMKAKAGREDDLRETLKSLVVPTHAEEGCIRYDLHENMQTPGEFTFYEIWTNREALDSHLRTPHLQMMSQLAPQLVEGGIELTTLNRLNQPKGG